MEVIEFDSKQEKNLGFKKLKSISYQNNKEKLCVNTSNLLISNIYGFFILETSEGFMFGNVKDLYEENFDSCINVSVSNIVSIHLSHDDIHLAVMLSTKDIEIYYIPDISNNKTESIHKINKPGDISTFLWHPSKFNSYGLLVDDQLEIYDITTKETKTYSLNDSKYFEWSSEDDEIYVLSKEGNLVKYSLSKNENTLDIYDFEGSPKLFKRLDDQLLFVVINKEDDIVYSVVDVKINQVFVTTEYYESEDEYYLVTYQKNESLINFVMTGFFNSKLIKRIEEDGEIMWKLLDMDEYNMNSDNQLLGMDYYKGGEGVDPIYFVVNKDEIEAEIFLNSEQKLLDVNVEELDNSSFSFKDIIKFKEEKKELPKDEKQSSNSPFAKAFTNIKLDKSPSFSGSMFAPKKDAPSFGSKDSSLNKSTQESDTNLPKFGSTGFGGTNISFGSTGGTTKPSFGSTGFGSTEGTSKPLFGSTGFGSNTKTPSEGTPKTSFGSTGFGSNAKTPSVSTEGTPKTSFGTGFEPSKIFGSSTDNKTPKQPLTFGSKLKLDSSDNNTKAPLFSSKISDSPFGKVKSSDEGEKPKPKESTDNESKTSSTSDTGSLLDKLNLKNESTEDKKHGVEKPSDESSKTTESAPKMPSFSGSMFAPKKDAPSFGTNDSSLNKPAQESDTRSTGFGGSTKFSFGGTEGTSKPLFGSTGFGSNTKTPSEGIPKTSFGSTGFGSNAKTPSVSTDGTPKTSFGSTGFGSTESTSKPLFGSTGFGSNTKTPSEGTPKTSFGSTGFGSNAKTPSVSSESTSKPLFGSTGFGSNAKTPSVSTEGTPKTSFGTGFEPSKIFGSSTDNKTPKQPLTFGESKPKLDSSDNNTKAPLFSSKISDSPFGKVKSSDEGEKPKSTIEEPLKSETGNNKSIENITTGTPKQTFINKDYTSTPFPTKKKETSRTPQKGIFDSEKIKDVFVDRNQFDFNKEFVTDVDESIYEGEGSKERRNAMERTKLLLEFLARDKMLNEFYQTCKSHFEDVNDLANFDEYINKYQGVFEDMQNIGKSHNDINEDIKRISITLNKAENILAMMTEKSLIEHFSFQLQDKRDYIIDKERSINECINELENLYTLQQNNTFDYYPINGETVRKTLKLLHKRLILLSHNMNMVEKESVSFINEYKVEKVQIKKINPNRSTKSLEDFLINKESRWINK